MLTLVPRPSQLGVGTVLRVPTVVTLPSGRRIPPVRYTALAVEWCRVRQAHRVVVQATLDCSRMSRQYQTPSPEDRAHGVPVPFAAQPTTVYLEVGEYVAMAEDNEAAL